MDMDNIGEIIASLSDKDIESLKQTAQSIFGETDKKEEAEKTADFSPPDPEMTAKIMRIMGALNSSRTNPRCELIKALKPLLKSDKQQKAEQALQIMKLLEILPLIQEMK